MIPYLTYIRTAIRRLILLFGLTVIAASASAQVNAEQVLAIGRNVLSMDDYMLSIQYFNQAIKAKPYLSDPYYFRALAKLSLEDYEGAEADCSLALERNAFKTETYKLRGFARQLLGKDSLAITDYDIGLRYNPNDKYFLFYKSVAQTELHDYQGADSTFSTLLRLYPRFDDGHTAHARLNMLRGDTVGALSDLQIALDASPNSMQALALRAELLSRTRQWEGALADIDRAINLRPREADLYINRAFVRYNLDDWFGAMSDYNYTLELEPENTGALFNRALLRYEVKDLNRAAEDLARVISLEPDNFHAQYNLGLVNLERNKPHEALTQFNSILTRYPRFYPAYYARAEAYRDMGNMRAAMQNVKVADDMVRGYVTNPDRNPLDKPTISHGTANVKGDTHTDESEEDVMERFNQLVTVSATEKQTLSYNERIKGRVQDRDIAANPEPSYTLAFGDDSPSLKATSNYFRALDDFNSHHYIADRISLTPESASYSEGRLDALFTLTEKYDKLCSAADARPADLLALGILKTTLKDYDAAERALGRALQSNSEFTVALIARAYLNSVKGDRIATAQAIADYDHALRLDPRMVYALYNKGNILYNAGDYTSALQCYTEAIAIDPTFGAALYNRGLTYLRLGNKQQAFADLSKAGELGVIPSYNLLKRMK